MKENADKHLDDLSRKIMDKSMVENPSFDFTHIVMNQIQNTKISKVTAYVPLISNRMWLFIGVGVLSILSYVMFAKSNFESQWLELISLKGFIDFRIPDVFSGFKMSQTLFYAVLLFAVMFAIQIPLIKRQFDKRFE